MKSCLRSSRSTIARRVRSGSAGGRDHPIVASGFALLLAVPLAAVLVTLVDVVVRNKNPAEEETPTVLFPAAKEAEH